MNRIEIDDGGGKTMAVKEHGTLASEKAKTENQGTSRRSFMLQFGFLLNGIVFWVAAREPGGQTRAR